MFLSMLFCFLSLFIHDNSEFVQATATSNALSSLVSSQTPLWSLNCQPSSAVQTLNTTQGMFVLCSSEDTAVIAFFSGPNQSLMQVLAAFQDQEINSYETRTISTGNWCSEIGKKSGGRCYGTVAGRVAASFFPQWSNPTALTDSQIASAIQSTFAANAVVVTGVQSRCFYNTGQFAIYGLSAQNTQLALTIRNINYMGCDNSEGDNRYWTYVLWFWPSLFGNALILIGTAVVGLIAGIGGCCCASSCAK